MRHQAHHGRLGVQPAHRRAMVRNMVTSLLKHERVKTTKSRAKEVRRYAEKMITIAKKFWCPNTDLTTFIPIPKKSGTT